MKIYGAYTRGPDDTWAVGAFNNPNALGVLGFAEHWDGHTWTLSPVRNLNPDGLVGVQFIDAVALSPDDVWIGGLNADGGLLEHWDRRSGPPWTAVAPPAPDPPGKTAIFALRGDAESGV